MRYWNYGTGDHLQDLLDVENLEQMVEEGYISKKKHPSADLFILNYTNKCQAEWRWNRESVFCRGVVVDSSNRIVSRPFPKFFDIESYPEDEESFKYKPLLFPKLDGALGISYPLNGTYAIASRGRFDSEHAKIGTEYLRQALDSGDWEPREDFTYLFEIIDPRIPIIVQYPEKESGLHLLSSVFTRGGNDILYFGDKSDWPYHRAEPIDYEVDDSKSLKPELLNLLPDDAPAKEFEGYIAFFPQTKMRMKIKSPEYRRVHKIIFGSTVKRLFNETSSIDEFMERFNDEVLPVVQDDVLEQQVANLKNIYKDRYERAHKVFKKLEGAEPSKETVDKVRLLTTDVGLRHAVLTALRNGEGVIERYIWKSLAKHPVMNQERAIEKELEDG